MLFKDAFKVIDVKTPYGKVIKEKIGQLYVGGRRNFIF